MGVTAATPENPDSFEIFKLVLQTATSPVGKAPPVQQHNPNQQPLGAQPQAGTQQTQAMPNDMSSINAQIVNLDGRLQLVNQATNNMLGEIGNQNSKSETRQSELLQRLATKDQVQGIDVRLQRLEQILLSIQRDLEGKDYRDRFNQLHETLRSSHLSLTENIKDNLLNGKLTTSFLCFGFRKLIPSNSYHGLNSPHGLLHLPSHCLPGPPRRFVRHL